MKSVRFLLCGAVCSLSFLAGTAQPDTAKINERALLFTDSLIKADTYNDWTVYANLAPVSVLKYYGGRDGYVEHVQKIKKRYVSTIEEEDLPQLNVVHLLTMNERWQCLVRESRYIHRDDKKLHVITYFLGESKDEGQTWQLFDVGFNAVANIIYIFPEVFGDMAIPEPTILSQEDELAIQQAQAASSTGKKTTAKKK